MNNATTQMAHWLLAAVIAASCAARADDAGDIRQRLARDWDKPDAPLVVGPLVTGETHAVADWQQGARGGRALLARTTDGWEIVVCGGDDLRDARTLSHAGVPDAEARRLADHLAGAEQSLDAHARARLASFGKVVDAEAAHGHHPPP